MSYEGFSFQHHRAIMASLATEEAVPIAHNTITMRSRPARVRKFSDMEIAMLQESLRRNGDLPAWYYDDTYDDRNDPTYWELMTTGGLR